MNNNNTSSVLFQGWAFCVAAISTAGRYKVTKALAYIPKILSLFYAVPNASRRPCCTLLSCSQKQINKFICLGFYFVGYFTRLLMSEHYSGEQYDD
jgi:hypothetical protein